MQDFLDYIINVSVNRHKTKKEYFQFGEYNVPKFINEYWTAKQRQANSIHEISYRACFKPQLPRFFINLLTNEDGIVFDPFCGRGTTAIESALLNRRFISNDINPLSTILAKPRVKPPELNEIINRLNTVDFDKKSGCDMDLSMFYHQKTLGEILCLKNYLKTKKAENKEDYIDRWIRMVATNRLTGHSKGFFSVYTLPPNQAVNPKSQERINLKRNQQPEYRNIKAIIADKSARLMKDINDTIREKLYNIAENSHFYNADARDLSEIKNESISLTVTSPPFLNIVQYSYDNWLRCWFNDLDTESIAKQIVMSKTVDEWCVFIKGVFKELFRVTKPDGYVAFEVGEVNRGKINLDEYVVENGMNAGFQCLGILVNSQSFTKTSNLWGINNNLDGTNTNRIVVFKKQA